MSHTSSTLFDDDAALDAAIDRVMAVLGGHLVEDTPTSADPAAAGEHPIGPC